MNKTQRGVVFTAVFFFVAAALYPPFVVETAGGDTMRNWYLLFSGPPSHYAVTDIDWGILVFEWCVILIAACSLLWASSRESRSTEEERSSVP